MLNRLTLRGWLLIAAGGIFVVSVTLPCCYTPVLGNEARLEATAGIEALLLGWVEVFDGFTAWLANPLGASAAALMLFRSRVAAPVIGAAAMGVALTFLSYNEILVNEAGNRGTIVQFGPAFWVWVLSFVVLTVAAVCPPKRTTQGATAE